MENIFDKIPAANEVLAETTNKEKEIADQTEIISKELTNLTTTNRIIFDFAVIDELRHALYRKGYNVIVNGDESIISIRDPKEDMNNDWVTWDCGGN